jgi:hypothetical protein
VVLGQFIQLNKEATNHLFSAWLVVADLRSDLMPELDLKRFRKELFDLVSVTHVDLNEDCPVQIIRHQLQLCQLIVCGL